MSFMLSFLDEGKEIHTELFSGMHGGRRIGNVYHGLLLGCSCHGSSLGITILACVANLVGADDCQLLSLCSDE